MKLSIITINYNNKSGLEQTMKSVLQQTCKEFEYIVVDGASTDGSVEVMNDYAQEIAVSGVKVDAKSEKDSGIYNAMNKGIMKASGEYLLMLNSGDYLVDEGVVEHIMSELDGTDIIQGNVITENSNGEVYRLKGYGRSDVSFFDAMNGHFLHQATFIKRSLHFEYGLYEDDYKKGADTYFFIHTLAFGNASFKYVNIDVSNFDLNGISSLNNPDWVKIDKEEDERWFNKNVPMRILNVYKRTQYKVKIFDKLHRHRFIWICTLLLVGLSDILSPKMPYTIKEKIR